jgi:hypothetical protein
MGLACEDKMSPIVLEDGASLMPKADITSHLDGIGMVSLVHDLPFLEGVGTGLGSDLGAALILMGVAGLTNAASLGVGGGGGVWEGGGALPLPFADAVILGGDGSISIGAEGEGCTGISNTFVGVEVDGNSAKPSGGEGDGEPAAPAGISKVT